MKVEPQPEPQEASKPKLDLPDWRPDDVEKIVVEASPAAAAAAAAAAAVELLRDQEYDEQQVPAWTDKICETCRGGSFLLLFTVQATLAQRGAGNLHVTSSSRFCIGADAPPVAAAVAVVVAAVAAAGVVTCVWPEERLHDQEARGVKAAVQVFGFAC
ncbi:hypothetical protein Emed_003691 [Eimeria media]